MAQAAAPLTAPNASGEHAISVRTSQAPILIDAAGGTHLGLVRERNEDAYLIATLQRSMILHDASPGAARGWLAGQPAGTLLVVADGMGGMGNGDVASRIAVDTVTGYLLNVMSWTGQREESDSTRERSVTLPDIREQLSSAIAAGNETVKSAGAEIGAPEMGTTLTAALISWPALYVAHVGDSRCSLLRDGQLTRLTTDHTLAQQLSEQDPAPERIPESWHHVLWNSLGGSHSLPKPQICKQLLEPNDILLLCSDGLTNHVSDQEIATILREELTNRSRCQRLIDRANELGGSDNITVVVADAARVGQE
jgi:PPM family protein phosphatase